jgi:hypothetical protein
MMNSPFQPKFEDFQDDIERYMHSHRTTHHAGDGTVVFYGYDDALKLMFRRYLDQAAFDPLVAHFRRWNWEVGYNEFLLGLTEALAERRDWPRLKHLWGGVIAKRRKLYNDARRIVRQRPAGLPPDTVQQIRDRLLDTLRRVRAISDELGTPEDSEAYSQMIEKVTAGRKV